jgi:hypothetical protein
MAECLNTVQKNASANCVKICKVNGYTLESIHGEGGDGSGSALTRLDFSANARGNEFV